jgi:hypothetical protein
MGTSRLTIHRYRIAFPPADFRHRGGAFPPQPAPPPLNPLRRRTLQYNLSLDEPGAVATPFPSLLEKLGIVATGEQGRGL